MKRLAAVTAPFLLLLCLFATSCSGLRPLQKGETERCPTCGVDYQKGSKHNCNDHK